MKTRRTVEFTTRGGGVEEPYSPSNPQPITADAIKLAVLGLVYPVGSIYMSVSDVNPTNFIGGTWVAWGQGRVPVGVNPSELVYSEPEWTGGSETHKITVSQMPSHDHWLNPHTHSMNHGHSVNSCSSKDGDCAGFGANGGRSGIGGPDNAGGHSVSAYTTDYVGHKLINDYSGSTGSSGSQYTDKAGLGNPISIMQPYITCYMWKRTA